MIIIYFFVLWQHSHKEMMNSAGGYVEEMDITTESSHHHKIYSVKTQILLLLYQLGLLRSGSLVVCVDTHLIKPINPYTLAEVLLMLHQLNL